MPAIPRVMSTQHPDNVYIPSFVQNEIMSADDELREALFCYKNLGCDEQMWDAEGKEAEPEILHNIFTLDHHFFRKNLLGKKERLTFRLPNPRLEPTRFEVVEKMFAEIPKLSTTAKLYYRTSPQPIFEAILPQTESAKEILQLKKLCAMDINIIPLFESITSLINSHAVVEKIINASESEYQRVFLARSDPALQSGMLAAVLGTKVALARLYKLSQKTKTPIFPIIGVGSAPFRGHFNPLTAINVWQQYAGAATITAQSSFKYDYPEKVINEAITSLKKEKIKNPDEVPEKKVLELITKLELAYQSELRRVIPLITTIAPYIPARRRRFGMNKNGEVYGRGFNGHAGPALPRAIGFTASLYSVGLPPELFGLNVITARDMELLDSVYPNWRFDVSAALDYVNTDTRFGQKLAETAANLGLYALEPHIEHHTYSTYILKSIDNKKITPRISEVILEAAKVRNFLG